MRESTFRKLQDYHEKMLQYQEQIKPFPPTIRELMKVFGISSTSATTYDLQLMEELGMVVTRTLGNKRTFYAVEVK